MKLVYYIDENCRNLRDLVPILKDIHLNRGISDVKIALTSSEFFRDTGFRLKDREIYFTAPRTYANGANPAFLIRHRDMMEFLAPTPEGKKFVSTFVNSVRIYLDRDTASETLPPEVELELRKVVAKVLIKYAPQLITHGASVDDFVRTMDLHIALKDKSPAAYLRNAILVASCMRCGALHRLFLTRPDHAGLTNDLADREILNYVRTHFENHNPADEETNFVLVTDDKNFRKYMGIIIEDKKRTGFSFCLKPAQFKASCQEVVNALQREVLDAPELPGSLWKSILAMRLMEECTALQTTNHGDAASDGYRNLVLSQCLHVHMSQPVSVL